MDIKNRDVMMFSELILWACDFLGMPKEEGNHLKLTAEFELVDDDDKFVEIQGRVAEIYRQLPFVRLPDDQNSWDDTDRNYFEQVCTEISKIHSAKDKSELIKAMKEIKEFIEAK